MCSQLKCDYFRFFRTQTIQQTLRSIFPKLSFRGVSIITILFPLTVLKVLLLLIWPYTQPLKEKNRITIKYQIRYKTPIQTLPTGKYTDAPGKIVQDY